MSPSRFRHAAWYVLLTIPSFLALQAGLVVLHEFTHRTMGFALGLVPDEWGIVWGNPVMMTGWDEGVPYSRLLEQGGLGGRVAATGVCPLFMHGIVVAAGLWAMRKDWLMRRKWLFHAVFWFLAANFMELVAYIFMRPFSNHGDTGLFHRGLGISPWWLFILGGTALLVGLAVYFRDALPRAWALFAADDVPTRWAILVLASFIIFLWGSGIRVMVYVSGPQWMFGLSGIAAFALCLVLFHPQKKTPATST